MKKVSVSLTAEHLERIEARAEADDSGRSAALRGILDEYEELQTEYEEVRTEYEQQIDRVTEDVERLQREKRQILAEREEKRELARYAEDHRTAAQRRREASVVARAKWWLFGEDRRRRTGVAGHAALSRTPQVGRAYVVNQHRCRRAG